MAENQNKFNKQFPYIISKGHRGLAIDFSIALETTLMTFR